MTKFNDDDLKTINKLYKVNIKKFYGVVILATVFWSILMFLPAEFLGRRGRFMNGSVYEILGAMPTLLLVLTLIVATAWVANYILTNRDLRKDLKEKEKITGTFNVTHSQKLNPMQIHELQKMGIKATDTLYFEENEHNITGTSYNKIINPKLNGAKIIYIEVAKNSRIELKREVKEI